MRKKGKGKRRGEGKSREREEDGEESDGEGICGGKERAQVPVGSGQSEIERKESRFQR